MGNSRFQYLISRNDRNEFDHLYHLYYEQVFRFAFYFVKDKDACREVVTNVFLALWKSRGNLVDVVNIETYLYVMTKNEATRFLKNNRDHKYVPLDEIPVQFESSGVHSPDNELLTGEIETLLGKVIAELPERCRVVFLMIRQEGLNVKDVAKILSINESTVRVQLKIAVDKIIEKLKPYFRNLLIFLLLLSQ